MVPSLSPVHLQIFLGAGLSLLCLSILLGCAMCWWHRRRPSPHPSREWAAMELGPALPAVTVPVPIQQQYEEMAGEVAGARAKESSLTSAASYGSLLHVRASLPTLPFLPQLAGAWQRRCTISGAKLLHNKESPLVHPVAGSPLPSEQRPRLHCDLSYSPPEAILTVTILGVSHLPKGLQDDQGSYVKVYLVPRLPACQRVAVCRRSLRPAPLEPCQFGPYSPEELSSFTLRFAVYARLRSLRDSFVGEVLFPCAQASWDPQASSGYTWELASTKTKLRKVRMAAVSSRGLSSCFGWRRFHGVSCSLLPFQCLRAHGTSCSVLSSSPKSLGQLFLLLQYQALAGRIKVLVRKAQDLGRLSRVPGTPGRTWDMEQEVKPQELSALFPWFHRGSVAPPCTAGELPASLPGMCPEQVPLSMALSPFPGHYIIIHLYHNGCVIDTKETNSISGYNPVWNKPFLFNIPAGDIQQQELALEFIVMQVRWMEVTMAMKVTWISCAPAPGELSPQRSHFLMPTGDCWGGITLLGVMESHQPCPISPLLPQARLHTRGSALGCVRVGPHAPGTGLLHWRDMCSQGPLESEQWHQIQPNTPRP
ncbi:uncharacterized protein LOC113953887 [Corapipo altera]|uniref:uncharacterized protein LOC113953887 n=1 Tax=Corapipo altera TaxID=415028 RepID=UPI000FD6A4CD|nr:uncharacterized protein LOC113953887 [Corapipo altera]